MRGCRDATLIAEQSSLLILWFSSFSSTRSRGNDSWKEGFGITCIQHFPMSSVRRRPCMARDL
jgi:hypothetical protein